MKTRRLSIVVAVVAAIPAFSLTGCYTQFGTSRDDLDAGYTSRTEEYADTTSEEDYAMARQKFYDDYYYPSYSVGLNFGWGYPWYGSGWPWYWDNPWYYGPYNYHYAGYAYNPWYSYSYPYYRDGYHASGGGRAVNVTRTFGSSRTLGGSRGGNDFDRTPSGSTSLPVGVRSGKTPTGGAGSAPVTRPGFSTGRRGVAGERGGTIGAPPPANRNGGTRSEPQERAYPRHDTPRPAPAPDAGRGNSAGNRSSDRPAYTPPPSPPPSNPAPAGGNRGNDSRGSSGGSGNSSRGDGR